MNTMKMSNNFKQIITLLLAHDVRFNLDSGDESYYLIKKDKNGRLIWEIDDKNKDNEYKIIFWDAQYTHSSFRSPIDYVITACNEERRRNQ